MISDLKKIKRLICDSQYRIHDISRSKLDKTTRLPRFNMPLELGVFIGAKTFGDKKQQKKISLILDKKPYQYQASMSDIAGQDICCHENNPEKLITPVRNWFFNASKRKKYRAEEK